MFNERSSLWGSRTVDIDSSRAPRPVQVAAIDAALDQDRPGMVGYLGTLLSKHEVNIASMSLSRDTAGGQALTVLNLDSVPPAEVLDEIQKDPDISNVKVVRL